MNKKELKSTAQKIKVTTSTPKLFKAVLNEIIDNVGESTELEQEDNVEWYEFAMFGFLEDSSGVKLIYPNYEDQQFVATYQSLISFFYDRDWNPLEPLPKSYIRINETTYKFTYPTYMEGQLILCTDENLDYFTHVSVMIGGDLCGIIPPGYEEVTSFAIGIVKE